MFTRNRSRKPGKTIRRRSRAGKALRLESLEPRMLMAADFDTRYYFDRRDIGGAGETPLVGDFNGDGRADIGVYIPNGNKDARWVVKFNQGGGKFAPGTRYDIDRRDIGGTGETPLVGDFDGDRKADIGVYIPNGRTDSRWVARFNLGGGTFRASADFDIDRRDIGGSGELPLIGDFNGDRLADIGVYIPNANKDARWVVKTGRGGQTVEIAGTAGDDHLVISQTPQDRIIVRDVKRGVDVANYPASQVHTIRVMAGDGNDIVDLRGVNGQQVTKVGDLRGGKGDDQLFLGNARGTLQGDEGNDRLSGSRSRDQLLGAIKYDASTDRYGVTMYEEIPVYFGMDLQPMARPHTIWVTGDWTEGRDPSGSMVAVLYQKAYLEFLKIKSRGPNGELLENSRWEIPVNSDWQSTHRAFFSLTGKSPTWVRGSDADPSSMQARLQANGAMVAASKSEGVSKGVLANHCYTVAGVYRRQSTWYVRLYNPWGTDGKDGPLFDQSSSGGAVWENDGFITLRWDQFTADFEGFSSL